jgi:SH3 domain protein
VKKSAIIITLFALLLGTFSNAQAKTRYVTDEFKIMLRSGESPTHRIVRQLPSGMALDILGSNQETGYSQVRTPEGTTGFVLSRQLMDNPSARERLATVEARIKELEQAPGQLSSKLATLQEEYQTLSKEHAEQTRIRAELEQELESIRRTSADAIQMATERTSLRKSVQELTHQVEDLKQQNLDLSNEGMQQWFLVGAGVIVLGILIGLILPRLRVQRRRDSWDSL